MVLPYVAIALLGAATLYAAVVSFRQTTTSANPAWFFPEKAGRYTRITSLIVTPILILVFFGVLGGGKRSPNQRSSEQRAVRFLIPQGYQGWVHIDFSVPGAPPLQLESGHASVRIPPEGIARTSSQEQYGFANDTYYYYSDAGLQQLSDSGPRQIIWGKINGERSGASGKQEYEEFYVGTEQQFRSQIEQERR